MFRPRFSRASSPPPPKKIHVQNSRPKLSAFLSNLKMFNPFFCTPIFCLRGRPKSAWKRVRRCVGGWEPVTTLTVYRGLSALREPKPRKVWKQSCGPPAPSDSQKNPIFITFELLVPRNAIRKKGGFGSGTLRRFARIAWFARICESIRSNRATTATAKRYGEVSEVLASSRENRQQTATDREKLLR